MSDGDVPASHVSDAGSERWGAPPPFLRGTHANPRQSLARRHSSAAALPAPSRPADATLGPLQTSTRQPRVRAEPGQELPEELARLDPQLVEARRAKRRGWPWKLPACLLRRAWLQRPEASCALAARLATLFFSSVASRIMDMWQATCELETGGHPICRPRHTSLHLLLSAPPSPHQSICNDVLETGGRLDWDDIAGGCRGALLPCSWRTLHLVSC